MPADLTMPERTERHGDAARPYGCYYDRRPPGAEFAIDYGYCRHSLDTLVGRDDPRCPAACPHKAPAAVVTQFDRVARQASALKAGEGKHEAR